MHLSELKAQHVSELITMGEALEIENVAAACASRS